MNTVVTPLIDREHPIVTEFREAGNLASYHYADDSCKEWRLGDEAKRKALALFDSHPELQAEMREQARGFLWSLSMERPQ